MCPIIFSVSSSRSHSKVSLASGARGEETGPESASGFRPICRSINSEYLHALFKFKKFECFGLEIVEDASVEMFMSSPGGWHGLCSAQPCGFCSSMEIKGCGRIYAHSATLIFCGWKIIKYDETVGSLG